MNDETFKEALTLYNNTVENFRNHMTTKMLIDDFFREHGIGDLLHLNYEEHKSLKEEKQNENIDYNKTIEMLSHAPKSETFIKMELEDYFDKYGYDR
ncbi:hypothetical protein MXL22_00715 [Staphylococcus pseudoxylosus]|uniref:hypothetical protein n=1 Tax=Staphylococcus pseudoxylosus TaxID=2282419 RepID=UPI002DB7CE01|nr:hypothetical protein [Staphylococcus pseudoxylosus]MEB6059604.1 hypothetical protein [Staphylococcus pseudoxylosus]